MRTVSLLSPQLRVGYQEPTPPTATGFSPDWAAQPLPQQPNSNNEPFIPSMSGSGYNNPTDAYTTSIPPTTADSLSSSATATGLTASNQGGGASGGTPFLKKPMTQQTG